MKNIIILILVSTISLFGQKDLHERGRGNFGKRFEELEKIKLLEMLNLDEEVTLKFFARRNNSRTKMNNLMKERELLFEKMESSLNSDEDANFESYIESNQQIEDRITQTRKSFINSLSDILTPEQITKVILFDFKFKKDVRDLLIERGRKRFFEERNKR